MTVTVSVNGVLSDLAGATVSVADRGFLYGDSAFEVMRTYRGAPFRKAAHLMRLIASCERLGIVLPIPPATLDRDVDRVLAAHRAAAADEVEQYIRVIVTRGTGPFRYDPATARDATCVIIVTALPAPPEVVYEKGVAAVCLRVSRLVDDPRGAGTKASNYLPNLLAVEEARQRGAEEALIVGTAGEVLEGTTSNVFVLRDGTLRTPPLRLGILAGITRALVLEAAATLRIDTRECLLFPADLYRASEVFITSTIREVVPVVRIDGLPIGTGQPGPEAARLRAAFTRAVERELAADLV